MDITVNGRPMTVEAHLTVETLILNLGLGTRYVAVEHNGQPLHRRAFSGTILRQGDVLEVVRPVAGG